MRRLTLTLLVAVCTLVACRPELPEPLPETPHDGVTLIHRGVPPYQPLRYHLARGTRTASELICDLVVKSDGDSGAMPALVIGLETSVEDVLADGSAKLRVTVVRTAVRDRAGSPIASDVVLAQAAAMQGAVITQTLAPDGQLADSRVEAATTAPQSMRDEFDRLTRSLQQVAMRMPAESVGVGAIWRERRTLPEGGIRATSETLYTLTSITGSTISYSSLGLSSGAPQTLEQDGMKVEVTDTRGHAEAKGSVDLSRYAFDVTSTSSFATAMNVIAPAGTPGAGPSRVEITMEIHVASAAAPDNASAPIAGTAPAGAATDAAASAAAGSAPSTTATPSSAAAANAASTMATPSSPAAARAPSTTTPSSPAAANAASTMATPSSPTGNAPTGTGTGSSPSAGNAPSSPSAGKTPSTSPGATPSAASETSPSAATAAGHAAAAGHQ